jgi:membrane fusion protein (multidrug efflux system)
MDGVIGVTNYTAGNYITPSSGVLTTINQVSPIRVQFAMSNRDFLQMFGTLAELKKEAKIALKLADDSSFEEIGKVEFDGIDESVAREAIEDLGFEIKE